MNDAKADLGAILESQPGTLKAQSTILEAEKVPEKKDPEPAQGLGERMEKAFAAKVHWPEIREIKINVTKMPPELLDSECIQALTQLMNQFQYLTEKNRNAIAIWFVERYRRESPEEKGTL